MKKIAFLFEGDIYNPRGEFIAIHNRLKYYKKSDRYLVDAYVCWPKYGLITGRLSHDKNGDIVSTFEKEGILYHCVWYPKSLTDGITHKFFKRSTDFEYKSILHDLDLKNYNLISAHSLKCARVASYYKTKYGIPYIATWHGSSIHSLPFTDKQWYIQTQEVLSCADYNFFVSNELETISKKIITNNSTISLNGIDPEIFYKFSEGRKQLFREKLGILDNEKAIAYVGNCFPIKNVGFLPSLFSRISKTVPNCHFCIVGDGPFKELFENRNLRITYFGSISYSDMPYYYNSFDLVVLPSIKEGLPMTCLEATACGTYFVGSRVGEIESIVGQNFTIPRDSNFDDSFVNKCIECLITTPQKPTLKPEYKAELIVENELKIIDNIIAQ